MKELIFDDYAYELDQLWNMKFILYRSNYCQSFDINSFPGYECDLKSRYSFIMMLSIIIVIQLSITCFMTKKQKENPLGARAFVLLCIFVMKLLEKALYGLEGQVCSFVLYPCTEIARMLALVVLFKKIFFEVLW